MNEFTPFPESTLRAIINNGYAFQSKDNGYVHEISNGSFGTVFITSDLGLFLQVKPEQISFREDTLRVTDNGEVYDFQLIKQITITINDIGNELV
jgi:hypothetical protein